MENKKLLNVDLESTDYDPAQVGNLDRRLEVGKKDAVFFHVLGVVATVIATIWMYAFGTGDPAEMRYFLGMPMWVSGAIVIYLAMFVVGMYWKKATAKGMFASTVGGFAAYVILYFISGVIPSTKEWWAAALGGVHAFLPAWLISLVLLVAVSYATQKERVKLGYFQVFFCEDYDEKYAKIDTLKD